MDARSVAQLDAADPLRRFRGHFAGDEDGVVAYLDGNSLGRPVVSVPDELTAFVRGPWGARLIRRWDEAWMDEPTVVGDRLGQVVLGAGPGQVIIGDSTSVLLFKLLRAAVDADPSRNEIVIEADNFPTDRYVVQGVAADRGLSVRWLETERAGGVQADDLEGVIGGRTAVVLLSHVAYRSGFLADAPVVTQRVHTAGAMMLWDLSHAVGSVPVELDAWGVDLAVGCTYKYLNGGPGSPAFAYVRRDLQDRLHQPIWGWMGAADPFVMGPNYAPAAGIRRFLSGTPAILATQPLKIMIELIAQAGMPAIRQKSIMLTERAVATADELLTPLGVGLASPRDAERRGSHVTLTHPRFGEVTRLLWERGVIPDFRGPDNVRIGLSPLSTSYAELDLGMHAVRDALLDVVSSRSDDA